MSGARPHIPSTTTPFSPRPPRQSWFAGLLRQRSVRLAATGWAVANVGVLVAADATLPFEWPAIAGRSVVGRLADVNLALLQVLLLMGVAAALTRRRTVPDLAARAPERSVAQRETLLLLGYGIIGLGVGFLLARSFGWHPFGLHLAGTLYGTHEHVLPIEAVVWASYNLAVYAVLPLAFFRRRYSAQALNLKSADRRGDTVLILVVLAIESLFQVLVLRPDLFDLSGRQLLLGATVTFVLYLAGAVLPAMVFIYAILVPRYLRLTGSTASTVILGGLTYTLLHVWDSWTVFTSPGNAALSLVFLVFTYFGPGMIKTLLTVRTGNAWVHVWAYHAFAPHTLLETTHMVQVFQIR
ncbi:MAG: hypothetical protein M3281_08180 [Chloroflexota bacterium]|nr:hypothetical protein [Chloroflexota bacterium]